MRRAGDDGADLLLRGGVGPEPGPDDHGPALRRWPPGRRRPSAGPPGAPGPPRWASSAEGFPGFPRRIIPAPAAMAPRVHRMADPSMPTDPDAMPSAVLHLCDWRGAGREPAATSASSISAARDAGERDADVRHLHRAAAAGTGALQEPGLVGREGHRVGGPQRRTGRGAGVGVHPGGDVDGEDRHAGRHRGRVVGAAEPGAVGTVDHQITAAAARRGRRRRRSR